MLPSFSFPNRFLQNGILLTTILLSTSFYVQTLAQDVSDFYAFSSDMKENMESEWSHKPFLDSSPSNGSKEVLNHSADTICDINVVSMKYAKLHPMAGDFVNLYLKDNQDQVFLTRQNITNEGLEVIEIDEKKVCKVEMVNQVSRITTYHYMDCSSIKPE